MDVAIIAVLGTLGGAIVSGLITYFVQSNVAEKRRKWEVEDRENENVRGIEKEKRTIKRGLIDRRVEHIEKVATMMMQVTSYEIAKAMDFTVLVDDAHIDSLKEEIDRLNPDAFNYVLMMESKELMKVWTGVAYKYFDLIKEGTATLGEVEEAQKIEGKYQKLIKMLDNIRSEV